MTYEDALELAQNEFARFTELFLAKAEEFPLLSFSEIDGLVEYSHPEFDNDVDQRLYDTAALVIAAGTILSTV